MANDREKHTVNEAELIRMAQADHRKFGILYDQYFERVFRFVFKRLGGDEATAGDLTQQCFLKAMNNLKRYEDRGYPFSSWLFRIAQNEVNLYFRQQQKVREVGVDASDLRALSQEVDADKNYMTAEEQQQLIDQLNALESEHADLIELRFFQKMSFRQIAEIYNVSEANAKMRIYRILEKIQKNWKAR